MRIYALVACLVIVFTHSTRSDAAEQPITNWIADISAVGDQTNTAAYSQLRLGCALEVTMRVHFKKESNLTAQEWEALNVYRAWVTNGGDELATRWATNGPLSPAEQEYIPVLKATYMFRGWTPNMGNPRNPPPGATNEHIYLTNLIHVGDVAFQKGYLQRVLDDDDVQALRDYAYYFAMRATSVHRLPFEFDLTRDTGNDFTGGEAAIPFTLPKLQSILDLPSYDQDVYQQDRTDFFKQTGVLKMLDFLKGYDTNGAGQVVHPRPVMYEGLSNDDYIALADYATDQRPVVVIFAYPIDVWLKILPHGLETLIQAYGHEVDFLLVNINYHDTYASLGTDFYVSSSSLRVHHPRTIEQRARIGKQIYMLRPISSLPMVLDDISSTARNKYFSSGGSGDFRILDKHGSVAYCSPYGWISWEDGNYCDIAVWLNDIELELNRLRTNGWVAEAGRDFGATNRRFKDIRFATRPAFTNAVARDYGYGHPGNQYMWLMGRIVEMQGTDVVVAVELGDRADMKGLNFIEADEPSLHFDTITTRNLATLRQWLAHENSTTTHHFRIGDGVELFVNGAEAETNEFKVGYYVGVWYDLEQDPTSVPITPIHMRAVNIGTTIPQEPSVEIDAGAATALTQEVTLTLSATNPVPVKMQICEHVSFAGSEWTNYTPMFAYTLSSGAGPKTVYARFSDGVFGVSETASDSIVYVPESAAAMAAVLTLLGAGRGR